jgi:hypothetical protein
MHPDEKGRLFYLRTAQRFPAVCVATQVTPQANGGLEIKYALSTYNMADLKGHHKYPYGWQKSLPFSRKESRAKARGRLSSPSHCCSINITSTDAPAHVKQRICEDIQLNSKSQIARECAALWLNFNAQPQVQPVQSEVEESVCEHTPTFPISIEVKPVDPPLDEAHVMPGIDYGIPIDHAPTELPGGMMRALVEISSSVGLPLNPEYIGDEAATAVEEQEWRAIPEVDPIQAEPVEVSFMDRVFGPFVVASLESWAVKRHELRGQPEMEAVVVEDANGDTVATFTTLKNSLTDEEALDQAQILDDDD